MPRALSLGFYLALLSLLSGTENFVVLPLSLGAEVLKVLVTLSFPPREWSDCSGPGSLLCSEEGEGGN